MNSIRKLSLYRAITGRNNPTDENWIYEGVSDEDLKQRGILCNNYSFAQSGRFIYNTPINRRVPGLPVFLNFDEAVYWIEGKKYETMPAIVESKVLLSELYGDLKKIKLVRNGLEKRFDYEPTEKELISHMNGEELIRGESFIQGINRNGLTKVLRFHEIIYRPNKMKNNKVDSAEGFGIYKLV